VKGQGHVFWGRDTAWTCWPVFTHGPRAVLSFEQWL